MQVDSLQAVFGIIAAGNSVRHVAGTNVNSRSSRSHTLLMMQLTQPSTAPEDEHGGGKKTKKQREKEREQAQMLHAPPAATTTISTLQVARRHATTLLFMSHKATPLALSFCTEATPASHVTL